MDSNNFITEVESRLTALAPEVIPGVIKKQLENLGVNSEDLTPEKAMTFVDNVTKALEMFLGPDGSKNAKKLMMRKLRQSCSAEELDQLIMK